MNNYSLNTGENLHTVVKHEPFRATRMWNAVVDYTRAHVDIKCHTIKRKSYNECFTGADVVDIVFHCLCMDRVNCTNTLSRDQAVKMCQLFLDFQIMSVVHSEHNSLCLFEDCSTTLYCFTSKSECRIEYDHKTVKCNKPAHIESSDNSENSVTWSARRSRIGREIIRLSGRRRCNPTVTAVTPSKCSDQTPSLPEQSFTMPFADRADIVTDDTKVLSFERDISNEILMNSLLELVDIPVLDDILHYVSTSSDSNVCNGSMLCDLTQNNSSFDDDLRKQDPWWQSANVCLSTLQPDVALQITKSSLSETTPKLQKILFFNCLAEKYAMFGMPLWPAAFSDVQLGLFRLLMECRCSDALRVLQLSFAMLSVAEQTKLHKLLTFLRAASDISAVQLSVLDVNSVVVERGFCDIFISSPLLTRHQIGQILAFAIANCDIIGELPSDVQDVIDARLGRSSLHSTSASLPYSCQVGKLGLEVDSVVLATNSCSALHVDSVAFFSRKCDLQSHFLEKNAAIDSLKTESSIVEKNKSYCERVSVEEYKAQCRELTDRALVDVMNSILDNTQISLKEKKKHLKQFMKHHSRLGLLHFSDIV